MKRFYVIFLLFLPVFLTGCGKSAPKNNPADTKTGPEKTISKTHTGTTASDTSYIDPSGEEVILGIDTSSLLVDTFVTVGEWKLIVGKNKKAPNGRLLSADDVEFEPLVISFYQLSNDSLISRERYEENQYVGFYSFQNNSLQYMCLSSYGGGSGYMSTLYKIQTTTRPELKPVMHYEELTSYVFNTNGTEVLRMQGIWDMSDNSDESHFSDHRYNISILNIADNKVTEKLISTTTHKYPSADVDFSSRKLLNLIRSKEPQVFEGIKLETYTL